MMTRAAAMAAFGLLCFSFAAGCGKLAPEDERGNTGTPSAGKPAPPEGDDDMRVTGPYVPKPRPEARTDLALESLATQDCMQRKSCGVSAAAEFSGIWGDDGNCITARLDYWAKVLGAKGVTVTQAQVDACAARQAQSPCETDFPECAFSGTEPEGATCNIDAQCASGRCQGATTKACGQCVAREPVGGECEHWFDCAVGLLCNVVTETCAAPLPFGAKCDPDAELCGRGLACLDGVCGARLPVGAACSNAHWRVHYGYYNDCARGSYCASATKTCTPFPELTKTAALGEPCDEDTSCQASICAWKTKTCAPFTTPYTLVCR